MGDFFDKNDRFLQERKEIEKCYQMWERLILLVNNTNEEAYKEKLESERRATERLLAMFYGSIVRGKKFLMISKKWRGKTLSEMINEENAILRKIEEKKNKIDKNYYAKFDINYKHDGLIKDQDIYLQKSYLEYVDLHVQNYKVDNDEVHDTYDNMSRRRMGRKKRKFENNMETFDGLNFLEKRSYKNKNKYGYNKPYKNKDIYSKDDNNVCKYKYLPTGVFYSRVSKSFIANWIDDKTKKQIKIPYKINDYGIETGMILAILSRVLRLSKISGVIRVYKELNPDQKDQILKAITTTKKSEKIFHSILFGKNKFDTITNDSSNSYTLQILNDLKLRQPSLFLKKGSFFEKSTKNTKKSNIEKNKTKYEINEERLPIGVYFYQGSFVANWWETVQKKQFKVPFKISEHGINKAKKLATISRIIRSSCIKDIKYILEEIELNNNIDKLDYNELANLVIKCYTNIKNKEKNLLSNT